MSKLGDKLKRLLQLATIREGEEENEGRMNEARTAAFLLLRECQKSGVKISFQIPREAAPAPPPPPPPVYQPPRPSSQRPQTSSHAANPFGGSAFGGFYGNGGADIFEEILRNMNDHVRRREAASPPPPQPKINVDIPQWPEGTFTRPTRAKPRPVRGEWGANANPDAPPIIRAKYGKRCRECGEPYAVGESVYWVRGGGCSHIACGYEKLKEIAIADEE